VHKIGRNLPPYPNSPTRCDKAKEPSDTDDRRHPTTSHEDPEGDKMYSSILSLTPALDGGGGGFNATSHDLVPKILEAGRAPGPVWTGAENLALTRIRSLDRPVRSELLY